MATRTAFGRRIYAIGGNLEAARLSGINVERTKLAVFAINGLMVAIAGLILSSRLGAGSPSAGNIAELDAIAACVIGGTSLAGGVGSVAGAVMGAFIMASLTFPENNPVVQPVHGLSVHPQTVVHAC